MRPIDESSYLTTGERRDEIAGTFAAGILRLRARAALPEEADCLPTQEIPANSAAPRLEVPPETVLSVHTG